MSDQQCPQCLGTGYIRVMSFSNATETIQNTCPLCSGSGRRKPTYEELEDKIKRLRKIEIAAQTVVKTHHGHTEISMGFAIDILGVALERRWRMNDYGTGNRRYDWLSFAWLNLWRV